MGRFGFLNRFGVWIFAGVSGLFAKLFDIFFKVATKRVAGVGAFVVGAFLITTGFFVALNSMLLAINHVIPAYVLDVAGHAIPANLLPCVSAIISAKLLRYTYDWKMRLAQYKYFGI